MEKRGGLVRDIPNTPQHINPMTNARYHVEKLYKITEAAEALTISRRTVYVLANEGRLLMVKVGRGSRIPQSSIEGFIATIKAEAAA